jgi:hypothetical protein
MREWRQVSWGKILTQKFYRLIDITEVVLDDTTITIDQDSTIVGHAIVMGVGS